MAVSGENPSFLPQMRPPGMRDTSSKSASREEAATRTGSSIEWPRLWDLMRKVEVSLGCALETFLAPALSSVQIWGSGPLMSMLSVLRSSMIAEWASLEVRHRFIVDFLKSRGLADGVEVPVGGVGGLKEDHGRLGHARGGEAGGESLETTRVSCGPTCPQGELHFLPRGPSSLTGEELVSLSSSAVLSELPCRNTEAYDREEDGHGERRGAPVDLEHMEPARLEVVGLVGHARDLADCVFFCLFILGL